MNSLKLFPPSRLNNISIHLPSSKSISNRALAIKFLTGTGFEISNLSPADDTLLMCKAINDDSKLLNLKNTGTAMRFLTACFAATPGKNIVLKGEKRMHSRPIAPLVKALKTLGADILYLEKEGFPPVKIIGKKLDGGEIEISADISSQFISALLLVAPKMKHGLKLKLQGEIVSRPYIQLTLDVMKHFGVKADFQVNMIQILPQQYLSEYFFVESDWSAASYIFAMAALFPGTEIKLPYLFEESSQGDSVLNEFIREFGVAVNFREGNCIISSSSGVKTHFFEKDFINYPDLIPTFVTLCCALKIPFKITGTKTLKYKESDRALALKVELEKPGFELILEENSISSFNFPLQFNKNEIKLNTYSDHRLAMSFSLLAVIIPGIKIVDPGVVEKSYPAFWQDLKRLGFTLIEEN